MPLTKIWPSRRPRVPPNAAASSASPAIAQSDPPNPPQHLYPDYIRSGASGPLPDVILTLLTDIPLGFPGPLSQVADILSSTVEAVKLMHENQEECAHLVSRVVKFIQSLKDGMRATNVSFDDGTSTAVGLIALKRYVLHRRYTSSALNSPFWR